MVKLNKYGLKEGTPIPDNLQVALRTKDDGRRFAAFNKAQIKLANDLSNIKGLLLAKLKAYVKAAGHDFGNLTAHQHEVFLSLSRAYINTPRDKTVLPSKIEIELAPKKFIKAPQRDQAFQKSLEAKRLGKITLFTEFKIDEEALARYIWSEKTRNFNPEKDNLEDFFKAERKKVVLNYEAYEDPIQRHREAINKNGNKMLPVGEIIKANLQKQVLNARKNAGITLKNASASITERKDRSEMRVKKNPNNKRKPAPEIVEQNTQSSNSPTENPQNLSLKNPPGTVLPSSETVSNEQPNKIRYSTVEGLAKMHHPNGSEVVAKAANLNADEMDYFRQLVAEKNATEKLAIRAETKTIIAKANLEIPYQREQNKTPLVVTAKPDYLPKVEETTTHKTPKWQFNDEHGSTAFSGIGHAINLARFGGAIYTAYHAKNADEARASHRELMVTGLAALPTFLSRHSEVSGKLATPAALLSSILSIGFAAHDAGAKDGRAFGFDKNVASVTGGTVGGWLLSSGADLGYAALFKRRSGLVKDGVGLALGIAAYTVGDHFAAKQAETFYDSKNKEKF